jgi:hypothetical protein
MDLGSILLGLAVLILVGVFVLRPVLQPSPSGPPTGSRHLSELQAERDRILDLLRDMDLDSTMGKLLPEDYRVQREALAMRGAAVLRQIDESGGSAQEPSRPSASLDPEAELEAAVRRLRSRQSDGKARGQFCSRCGAGLQPDDRFCANCGEPVPAAEPTSLNRR